MPNCRSCRAEVRWVRTAATGGLMPLDLEPNPDGNVRLEPKGSDVVAVVLGAGTFDLYTAQAAGEELYMPHHATCPDADKWHPERSSS